MKSRDVSKEAVVVLLLLTVVVALIGSISVTRSLNQVEFPSSEISSQERGTSELGGMVISEPRPPQYGKASITFATPGDESK